MKKVDYLIIGAGIAAVSAAKGIREIDRQGTILMIGEESLPPYKKPMLTKTPLYGWDPERMVMHDAAWFAEKSIDLKTAACVTSIDPAAHTVKVCKVQAEEASEADPAGQTTEEFAYGKLIYAAGGSAFVPPIPGADLPGVLSIRNDKDIAALRRLAVTEKQAVIIGGASMSGGRGTLRGTLAGALVLGIVSNILDLWGVAVSLQGCVKGLVIVVSVLVQRKGKSNP